MFRNTFIRSFGTQGATPFLKTIKANVSNKRHQTRFDIHVDWLKDMLISKGVPLATLFAGINLTLFLYANLRYNKEKRWLALSSVSFSAQSLKNKDYIPLFASLIGSHRIDDLIFETAVFLTLGNQLEKLHGSPFIFKMFLFTFAVGILSSLWWVKSNHAKRERYFKPHPNKKEAGSKNEYDYRFMSSHSLAMSLVYFSILRSPYRIAFPFVLALDLYVWGPYYLPGAMIGSAFALIV